MFCDKLAPMRTVDALVSPSASVGDEHGVIGLDCIFTALAEWVRITFTNFMSE